MNLRNNQQEKTTFPPMEPSQEIGPSEQHHVSVIDCDANDDDVIESSPGAFAEVYIFLVFLNFTSTLYTYTTILKVIIFFYH